MATIYIDGLKDPITVIDAPDFEEAVAMISDLPLESMVVFPRVDSDVAVAKGRLIMFLQEKTPRSEMPEQYVVPSVPVIGGNKPVKKRREMTAANRKARSAKDVRPKSVQKRDSE